MFNLKKNLSYIGVLVIGLGLGLGLTYVSAEYTDQSSGAPNNNTPTPILVNDINGDKPFIKIGKLGISTGSTNADVTKFDLNSIVVGGETSVLQGLSVSGDASVRAELPTSSSSKAFYFGDITDQNLWQTTNNEPRKFAVYGYTRAPRVVIGSASITDSDPLDYNLYIYPEGGHFWSFNGIRSYCTLTANDLKNKGCPVEFQYNSKKLPTYMSQVIPGTGTAVVARCNMMTEQYLLSTTNPNLGTCYP